MSSSELSAQYDRVAPVWGDKMRMLGYYDAYLGFLASETDRAGPGNRVLDVGCGSGAFADAWAAIHGPDQSIALLDPSRQMLTRARATLAARGLSAQTHETLLDGFHPTQPFDTVLAAHVIEHVEHPVQALSDMRSRCRTGGQLWLVVSKPHWCNAIIWLQWRHRAYRPESVARVLQDSGWVLDTEYAFPSGPPSRTSRGYLARAV